MTSLTDTGKEFLLETKVVICCINFSRRPFLAKTYIRNHELTLSFIILTFLKNMDQPVEFHKLTYF